MKKPMTEAQAWEYIAKTWDKPKKRGDGYCCSRDGCSGVCFSISNFQLLFGVVTGMTNRLRAHRAERADGYWWPQTRAGARSRAAFCRRMARECRKEAAK